MTTDVVLFKLNKVAERFVNVSWSDYNAELKKFLQHLDETKLISNYIKTCGEPTYDVATKIEEAIQLSRPLPLGESTYEAVANSYHILKYCDKMNLSIHQKVGIGYFKLTSASDKSVSERELASYDGRTQAFNQQVVKVLVDHITAYLNELQTGPTPASPAEATAEVPVIEENNNPSQPTNEDNLAALAVIITAIKAEAKKLPTAEQEEVDEYCEVITDQAHALTPKKSMLKTALTGLRKALGDTPTITSLANFLTFKIE